MILRSEASSHRCFQPQRTQSSEFEGLDAVRIRYRVGRLCTRQDSANIEFTAVIDYNRTT
jgi:hypothetical protein